MSNNDLSLLGLAARARKIATGDKAIESIRQKNASLVLLATDASQNTKKMITNKCDYYHIDVIEVANMEELSAAIGKSMRAYVAINDAGFAKSIKSRIGR